MLEILLPPEIEERLQALASATGRSTASFAKEAIMRHLAELEDIYLAEQRLSDVQTGRSKTYTLAEIERDLGLAD